MIGVIVGELHKVPAVLGKFPLLMSRSGRGVLLVMTGLVIWCLNVPVLVMINPAIFVGILNIWLGWGEDRVEIHMCFSETAKETTVDPKSVKSGGKTGNPDAKPVESRDIEIEGFD